MKKIVFGVLMVLQQILASPTTLYEIEPNNTPLNATPFSGETLVTGMLEKGDQDAYMWKLGKEDSLYTWNIELVGIPDGMTRVDVMKVVFTPDGKSVEDYKKFFSFGTRTGEKPVHLNNVLFDKGEYLIAVSSKSKHAETKKHNYQINFTKVRKATIYKTTNRERAKNISSTFYPVNVSEKVTWFSFDLNKKESQKLWTIEGVVTVGYSLNVTLEDKEGHSLFQTSVNKFGKYKFVDLELDEGEYYLKYTSNKKNAKYATKIYSTGAVKIDTNEVEPNNDVSNANAISYKKIIHGTANKDGDYDVFRFVVPPKYENKIFDITLDTEDKESKFTLLDSSGDRIQDKSDDSNFTMSNLRLEANQPYYISVYTDKNASAYNFKFSEFRDAKAYTEVEPNDERKDAYTIPVKEKIEGYFQGDEYDYFTFNIVKPHRLWNIVAEGQKLKRLEFYKASSSSALLGTYKYKRDYLSFNNLPLLPGKYQIRLSGKNGKYKVSVNEVNLSDVNISSLDDLEHEPNENEEQTNQLKVGQTIKGMLENRNSEDYFHFTLDNDTHIRLTAIPPKDGDIRFKITSNIINHSARPKMGEKAVLEGTYPAGRYTLEAWTDKPSYGLYSLKLEALDYFDSIDKERNDDARFAMPMPTSFHLKGFTSGDDEDWFTFPAFMTKETNLTISGHDLEDNIELYDKNKKYIRSLEWDNKTKTYTAHLKYPNESYFLIRSGAGLYDYELHFSEYTAKVMKPLDITLDAIVTTDTPAAFNEQGQRVKAKVTLNSTLDTNLSIVSHSSNSKWHIEIPDSVYIKAGTTSTLPLRVVIPKNVDTTPVRITLKFTNQEGAYKTLHFTLTPKMNAKPVDAYDDWGLPDELLGGLNVARLDYGAQRMIEHNETSAGYVPDIGSDYQLLFDDVAYNSGFHLYGNRKSIDENVTIKLAGSKTNKVVGVILNPFAGNSVDDQLKDFSISLSKDGKNYTPVFNGTLGVQKEDQAFVFDKSYDAKYARLTLHNNYNNDKTGSIILGEWKVIAKQESVGIDKAFNIADPKLGGHVVKASKVLSSDWDRYILTSFKYNTYDEYLYQKDKVFSWVVGFKNERTAQIKEINWYDPKNNKDEMHLNNVDIYISTQTPNGPWVQMPTWHLSDMNLSRYVLKKPVWARYVKFSFSINKDGSYIFPEILQILESKPSKKYKSILGEWGGTNYRSYYEYLKNKNEKKVSVITGNEHKKSAYTLDKNETVKGRVSVFNHEEDWYKVNIDKDHTKYSPVLSGRSSVDVVYELFDNEGRKIAPLNILKSPQKHTYSYLLNKGTYLARVIQPPISVVFAWDNSGSVSPYHTQIFDATNYYIQTIQPHVDSVNLLCFNGNEKLILDDFSDKPTQVQMIFNNFDSDCGDSDAEKPLRKASEVLAKRDGIKGVIIIGDAVGSRDIKLWDTLKAVKPKVFSIRVQSGYDDSEKMYEGIMQSWSRVNNGTYNVVSNANGAQMYHAISRASAILRRPVYYTLKGIYEYQKPKGPGTLSVMFDQRKKAPVNNHFAVELILDASGSMLKKIHGKRRIAIARDVLKKAVRDIIPPKTLVALRAFGHKQADSCRTDLEVRLQPLQPYRMMQVINRINAKNLAKTPIADSLAKVANDLQSVKGKKVVILVTDGEETCDGDPAKVIADLKAQGIDIRVNIVGFAIDNMALKEKFRKWASLGNGSYFDARDQRSLDAAVVKALQVPYKVYDKSGKLLAKSTVGSQPITLPEGMYKIVVESARPVVYEGIIVRGEQQNQVLLQHEGIQ